VTKTYEYDAYGNEKNPDDTDSNHLRYCGEYYDAETGTYYLRARYYNPRLGRFASEDPARSGLNWYMYCAGSPVAFIDPSGCTIYLPGNDEDNKKILEILQDITDYYYLYPDIDEDGNVIVQYETDRFRTDNPKYISENELLRALIDETDYHLAIVVETGLKENSFSNTDTLFDGVNYDGLVRINPEDGNVYNVIGTQGIVYETVPAYLLLSHELIHAYRHMKGYYLSLNEYTQYYVDYLKKEQWSFIASLFNFTPTKK